MTRVCVGTEVIQRKKVEITFSAEIGTFFASVHKKELSADTYDGLKIKIARALKEKVAKVEVPFTCLKSNRYGGEMQVINGIGTGIHTSNRNLIVRYDGGSTEQISHWGSSREFLRRLSADEAAEWKRLNETVRKAQKALAAFTK
jgi:hypothetical protein